MSDYVAAPYQPGEQVAFGHYRQAANDPSMQEIVWRVLAQRGSSLLLLSEKILEVYPFQRRRNGNAWESSLPRNWLNTVFLSFAFDAEEQEAMIPFCVGSDPSSQQDMVTLPGKKEILCYLPDLSQRRAKGTDHAIDRGLNLREGYGWWWLRSRGIADGTAQTVAWNGEMDQDMASCAGIGLRPMICVDTTA